MSTDNNTFFAFPDEDFDTADAYDFNEAPAAPAAPAPAPATRLQLVSPEAMEKAAAAAEEAAATLNPYGKVPDLSKIAQASKMPLTSMGLGARLALHYRDRLAWVTDPATGGSVWYSYNGKRWAVDPDGLAAERATRATIMSIVNEEAEYVRQNDDQLKAAEAEFIRTTATGDAVLARKAEATLQLMKENAALPWTRFGEQCQNGQSHIKAATAAAKDLMGVSLRQFDNHPTWCNTQNGTVDVRTKELMPHSPRHYLTKITSVDYVPGAWHIDVQSTLDWLGENDPGLPTFMLRYLGSATTALHSKSFCYQTGVKNAGKSAFVSAVCHALGDVSGSDGYAKILSPKVIAMGKFDDGEGAKSNLHSLMGVRLVFMDEAEKGFPDAENLKKLASGGEMTTRPPYGKAVTWRSQLKIFMAGNGRMAMPDNDSGIDARLIAGNLPKSLGDDRLDLGMEDRLRERPQQEALLAALIDGGHEWLNLGGGQGALGITDLQRAETLAYKSASDLLGDFWEDSVMEVQPGEDYLPLTTSQWHELFTRYCRRHGMQTPPLKSRQMGDRMTKKGFPATDNPTTRTYGGVSNVGKLRLGIRSVIDPQRLVDANLDGLSIKPLAHPF